MICPVNKHTARRTHTFSYDASITPIYALIRLLRGLPGGRRYMTMQFGVPAGLLARARVFVWELCF